MHEIERQITTLEDWLREHPNADQIAKGEIIRRLRELNEALNGIANKINNN